MVPWMSGLVSGLQNRVRRFESARNLTNKSSNEAIHLRTYFFLQKSYHYNSVLFLLQQRALFMKKARCYLYNKSTQSEDAKDSVSESYVAAQF